MNNQRGSVTVIAIVMLLFLMVIAIAWLPMMTMEKTAASSDYREQQAWYAAEAGYKRAVAQLDAEKGSVGYWYWLSREAALKGEGKAFAPNRISWSGAEGAEADGVWYAAAINYKDGDTVIDVVDGYKPVKGTEYSITVVGSCQGVRKVIRKTHTPGGIDIGGGGGDSGGEEVLELPGLVQAGGTVSVSGAQGGSFGGNLYGKEYPKNNGNDWIFGKPSYTDFMKGEYDGVLKTHIPDNVFEKENYADLNVMSRKDQWNWVFNLESGKNYFWDLKSDSAWYAGDYTGGECTINAINSSGAVVFIDNKETKTKRMTGKIIGPESGLPVTIIFTGNIELSAHISGNVRVFAAGDFKILNNQGASGLIMLMSNGEMNLTGIINKAFLSSDKNMTLTNSGGFYGQAQVRGDFKTDGAIYYSDAVLKADGFTVPKGMK